ncbi:hypothetical protein [Bacillus sp. FSL R12-0069]|uniref:hypothetical protein n=1 Tax=Bacillus sp. FSL R12-0069 TaxID=2975342 RepID=UPI0030F83B93
MRKILVILVILTIICIMFFEINSKDKVKLTTELITKVTYLETNSVSDGMIRDYGKDAKKILKLLIKQNQTVSLKKFWQKKIFENSSHPSKRMIEFSLEDGQKITFEIVSFQEEGHEIESYIRCVGNSTIYYLNAKDTEEILIHFVNR